MVLVFSRPEIEPRDYFGLLTVAPEMERLFEQIEAAALSEAPILIRGETGTGKELVAKAIHSLSGRSGAFQAINCATFTPVLMASELFGHVKGAFTGAIKSRPGVFRLADGGTLFMDEIAEMPLDLQARVLRVLQEQQFVPLGASEEVSVDVRIVSATHVALRDAVEARQFREDLMYRIRVIPLYLPALRARTGDVEALAWAFLDTLNARSSMREIEAIDATAREALLAYDWPGNVRELHNVMEYAHVMGKGPVLLFDDLPPELAAPRHARRGQRARERPVERDAPLDRELIAAALDAAEGNRAEAAHALGISRTTLWRRMREHGLA
jgi:transcriptional regulator with PAS, ATPase and Fis domain